MATQKTTRLRLEYWQLDDPNWHVPYADTCAILDGLEAIGSLAVRAKESPSTTLNVAVSAGSFRKSDGTIVDYAGTATQLLTASATNSLYLTDAGTLTVATTGWPATTYHVRLAIVTTNGTTVTGVVDARIPWVSQGKNGNTIYLSLAGGTFSDGSGVVTVGLGSTNGTKLGSTGDKLGFLGATPVVQQANTVDIAALLATFGLRASGGNPPLNLGSGTLTCGAINVGGLTTLADAQNVAVGTTTGTKIGTATTQKLAFFNATPVVQPANTVELVALLVSLGLRATGGNPDLNLGSGAITCGALNVGGLTTLTDAQNIAVGTTTGTKIGTATAQKLGFWNAAPVVQPAGAAQAAITDGSGGTPGASLAAVGATNSGDVSAAINNNFATLWTLQNAMRAALVAAGLMKGSA